MPHKNGPQDRREGDSPPLRDSPKNTGHPRKHPWDERKNYRANSEKGASSTEITMAICTAIIAICTVAYSIFAGLQWWEIRNGSSDTHTLAVAADNQTNLLRQEMEGMYGAKMVTKAEIGPDIGLVIFIHNIGRVMSPKIAIGLDVFRQKYPGRKPSTPLRHFDAEITQMTPVPIGEQPQPQLVKVMPISEVEYGLLSQPNPKYTILLEGVISYDAGFGRKIDEHVCWVYIHLPSYKGRYGSQGGVGGMIPCGEYESAIANYWKNRKQVEQPDSNP